jgi:UDP-N-acetyl-2-amino-2-deoxyglucuronate dehydrogenase
MDDQNGKRLLKIKVAYVGCGGIAERYLNVYRELDFVEVAVCIDSDLAAAQSAAQFLMQTNGRTAPIVTTDYAEALTDEIDVVVINTPNHLHHEQAIDAFAAEKHVFLQKPVAPTLEESEAIERISQLSNASSGLYMSYFDQPLFHDFKAMIEQGFFGEISHFYGRLMHRGGQMWSNQALNGNRTWRDSATQTGGGCFVQLAVHYIHLMEWMLKEPIVRVTAVTKNLRSPGLEGEDIASVILEFESGVMATLDMAWNSYGEQFSIHGLEGSTQYLNNRILLLESAKNSFTGRVINYQAEPKYLSTIFDGAEQTIEVLPLQMGDVSNEFNQHRVFLENIRDGKKPFVSIASGVEDMRVVAAVYESALQGCAIEVERKTSKKELIVQV